MPANALKNRTLSSASAGPILNRLTEWRWLQSPANSSLAISLIYSEKTGNSSVFLGFRGLRREISSNFQWVRIDFPIILNRELFKGIRETCSLLTISMRRAAQFFWPSPLLRNSSSWTSKNGTQTARFNSKLTFTEYTATFVAS